MRGFINRPSDFSIFGGMSEHEFQNEWFAYIRENYLDIPSAAAPGISANADGNEFRICSIYPNPFNPSTTIMYMVRVPCRIDSKIFNVLGHGTAALVGKIQTAGIHDLTFEGKKFSSGIYFCRLQAGTKTVVRTRMLLK